MSRYVAAVLGYLGLTSKALSGPTIFVPAARGCGMAHCDPHMSDQTHMLAPKGDLVVHWDDLEAAGDFIGLGCSSNTKITACALGPEPGKAPYLRVYNADGKMIWSYPLNPWTWSSAPVIDKEGRVIAADNEVLVLFESDGTVVWKKALPGGLVISPVVTENGLIVFVTLDGFVSTVDPTDGTTVGQIELTDRVGGIWGTFGSRNTPAVENNRIYMSTEFKPRDSLVLIEDETRTGRLYAIDVRRPSKNPSFGRPEKPLEVAWYLPFGSRSGSSPTYQNGLIYFDGDFPDPRPEVTNVTNPHFFAVQDMGDHGRYHLQQPTAGPAVASAAADPRPDGGVWYSSPVDDTLYRLGPDADFTRMNPNGTPQGTILETLHTSQLGFGTGYLIGFSSAVSVGMNEDGDPVLMFCVVEFHNDNRVEDRVWHMGWDLVKQEVRYKAYLGQGFWVNSPGHATIIMNDDNRPVLVLAMILSGVIAFREPTAA